NSLRIVVPHVTPTTELYTLSLHDALPIFPFHYRQCRFRADIAQPKNRSAIRDDRHCIAFHRIVIYFAAVFRYFPAWFRHSRRIRSEEHTSELQSREKLVCRLLLEKKKNRS